MNNKYEDQVIQVIIITGQNKEIKELMKRIKFNFLHKVIKCHKNMNNIRKKRVIMKLMI